MAALSANSDKHSQTHICHVLSFAFVLIAFLYFTAKLDLLSYLQKYVGSNPFSEVTYLVLSLVSALLLIPMSSIEILAGIIWHKQLYKALILGYVGKMLGCWGCFGVGRLISIRKDHVNTNHYLKALEKVYVHRPHTLTPMICLAYLPASLKFYGLGTIKHCGFFNHFLPWSCVCGLPYAVGNVMVGVEVGNGVDNDSTREGGNHIVMILSILATVGLLFIGGKWIKFELERIIKEDESSSDSDSARSLLRSNRKTSSYDAIL